MNPTVTVARKNNSKMVTDAVAKLAKKQVYVGIPSADSGSRRRKLLELAANTPGIVAKADLMRESKSTPSNAELLWIFSKGSPMRGQPARPVLEPAIVDPANKPAITAELEAAAKAVLDNKPEVATTHLKRAGLAAQRAAQKRFTTENGWQANAPSTIEAKGSDRPGIATGAMRAAITYSTEEE